ncbi:MAG: hypothetical protein JW786_00415 [Desulfobacterales bacterium]|nr:hypothetical protein [Desulfobacterales bacterium]
MKYNPDIHHRRSIRLKGYDYSHAGLYFITICTQDRLCLFGKIENGAMVLSDAGKMANKWWNELKHKYQNIRLHEQIVMPNHFHGIIEIIDNTLTHVDPASVGADLCVCPNSGNDSNKGEHTGSPLHSMVQWFKTINPRWKPAITPKAMPVVTARN